jgi:inorganic pyrophosphatase
MDESVNVFIENEAGSLTKNLHDERSLTHTGSVPVSHPYPFPYGFLLDTTNEDGDNLDCFVLTRADLRRGIIVECNVLGRHGTDRGRSTGPQYPGPPAQ